MLVEIELSMIPCHGALDTIFQSSMLGYVCYDVLFELITNL